VNATLPGRTALAQRRLRPVVLTVALLILGQIAAFVTLGTLMSRQDNQRRVSQNLFIQRTAVAAHVRHTHVALFALAVSDWDLLIRERRGANQMAERYEQAARALLAGANSDPTQPALEAPQLTDPEVRRHVEEGVRRWQHVRTAAALGVLYGSHYLDQPSG
jgi:hypothetical protein